MNWKYILKWAGIIFFVTIVLIVMRLTVNINRAQTQTQHQTQYQVQNQNTIIMNDGARYKSVEWEYTNTGDLLGLIVSLPFESAKDMKVVGKYNYGFKQMYEVVWPVYSQNGYIQTNVTSQSNTQKGVTNKIKIKLFGK